MSATVGEPEARGSYLKKHTTFVVTLESQQSRMRRRFSDFVWLHSVLRARYAGMLVPSLPDKTTVLKTDAYIQSRIRGLSLFLDAVLQSPYLRSDEAVVSFFAISDEKEWEAAKRATAVMENAGPGHLRWLMRITAEAAPSDFEPYGRCVCALSITRHYVIISHRVFVVCSCVPCSQSLCSVQEGARRARAHACGHRRLHKGTPSRQTGMRSRPLTHIGSLRLLMSL